MARRFTGWIAAIAIVMVQVAPTMAAAQVPGGNNGGSGPRAPTQPYPDRPQIQPPGGGRGGYAGELRCVSQDRQPRTCPANTRGRVVLVEQLGGNCRQGDSWRYDNRAIYVRDGCRARFAYGYANAGYPGPGYPGGGFPGNARGFAGEIRCESQNRQPRTCGVNTERRVVLVQQLGGNCREGVNWSYNRRSISVDDGCRARFAYGYGNTQPGYDDDRRPNTGALVAGGVIAAGLIAILASRGRDRNQVNQNSGPARLVADTGGLSGDARRAADTCFAEAARQVGSTGGTELRLGRITDLARAGDGWRIGADLTGSWPREGARPMRLSCRASGGTIRALDFA